MANERRFFVTSFDGAAISARDFGGSGPALLLLSGWACTQVLWDPVIPHLKGFRTLTLDFAGFGTSGAAERGGMMSDFARDVRAVIEAGDLRDVTLVGHSMGGAVAIEAAALLPDRIIRVLGCDSFTYPTIYERQDEAAVAATMAPFRADFAQTVRSLMPAFLLPDGHAATHALALDTMAAADPACAVPALEQLLRWDVEEALARCAVPVATVNAAGLLAPEIRERYAARIDIRTIQGVDHFLMMERPATFAAVVAEIVGLPST